MFEHSPVGPLSQDDPYSFTLMKHKHHYASAATLLSRVKDISRNPSFRIHDGTDSALMECTLNTQNNNLLQLWPQKGNPVLDLVSQLYVF